MEQKDTKPFVQMPEGNDWISIDVRVPEINQKVIGFRPTAYKEGDDVITILKYIGHPAIDSEGVTYKFERCHHVTHWKPLPRFPKEYEGYRNVNKRSS